MYALALLLLQDKKSETYFDAFMEIWRLTDYKFKPRKWGIDFEQGAIKPLMDFSVATNNPDMLEHTYFKS